MMACICLHIKEDDKRLLLFQKKLYLNFALKDKKKSNSFCLKEVGKEHSQETSMNKKGFFYVKLQPLL